MGKHWLVICTQAMVIAFRQNQTVCKKPWDSIGNRLRAEETFGLSGNKQ